MDTGTGHMVRFDCCVKCLGAAGQTVEYSVVRPVAV